MSATGLLLQAATPAPSVISLPSVDVPTLLIRLLLLIPLVGGYLLAREGRGNLLWEILAAILLVLATTIPTQISEATIPTILEQLVSRWPVIFLLLGLGFIRDGGAKMILGIVLMAFSGLVLLPRV